MNDDLGQLFTSLKLRKIAEIYDAESAKADCCSSV